MLKSIETRLLGLTGAIDEATPEEWIAAIEGLNARGQPFLAYDLCRQAEERFPEQEEIRLLGILALLQGHSGGAARQALEALSAAGGTTVRRSPREMELLAKIHRLCWEQWGGEEDLRRAQALYGELFEQGAECRHGSEAAVMGWCLGHHRQARAIAGELIERCAEAAPGEPAGGRVQRLLHQGLAAVVLERSEQAAELFGQAVRESGRDYHPVVGTLRRLRSLRRMGLTIAASTTEILRPPRVVIFGGQLIDPPAMAEAIFPPDKERPLRRAIEQRLAEIDARIGYSSAACGSDLLFIEAMLERGGEVHLVLPCALPDFIEARVAYAGARWRERLEAVLPRVTTVTYATHERYLGHQALLRYANHIITGLGWLRGDQLLTQPHLLAVWDYRAINSPGSSTDFIDHWPDITTLHLIELDELAGEPGEPGERPRAPAWLEPARPERTIRAMLFADVVGYSKVGEEYLPNWFQLLERIHQLCASLDTEPELVETWGDAFYIVMPSARTLVKYAFLLREAFLRLDHRQFGLPRQLNVRIGLHAGPVFQDVNPMTGRLAFSGRQVNRAARIEPITMPGEVYASQELVALLTAEENAVKHELAFLKQPYAPWFKAEYLGIMEMPKQHGEQPMYHLLPAEAPV